MSLRYGFEADIHRALWERPQMWGAPKLWSIGWIIGCLYAGLLLFVVVGPAWALLAAGAWFVGQTALVGLTVWDPDWDLLMQAHLTQRSRAFYDAG
jgi:type IV secretory pathway TrbD component